MAKPSNTTCTHCEGTGYQHGDPEGDPIEACDFCTPVLRLNLKREYWEAIRAGEKIYEYRLATPYWLIRLGVRKYSEVHLCLGYPNRGETERVLKRKWTGVPPIVEITHPHFGNKPVKVFAIDVTVTA